MSEAERTQGTTGRLLAGRYRLGEVLGRGGMGTVWRARDEILGRTVAVKELRFPNSVDEDEKRRLITRTLREAKAIARIRNNGAVTVYDVVDEDDRPWIVMELVEGRSLADVVRDDGALTPYRAAEVGLAILDVLRAAHREGILHRDVKPSNVLISDDGRVVLTDFGIAQVEGDPSVTSTGMLVGAPSYIAPERARGHKPGPPADLWSLGGLLYAAVEGVPPYDKSTAIATLTAVMTEPLERPKNAGALEQVIYGLLVKDPAGRLDDAGARALLNEALNAPEGSAATAAEPTRAMPLPPVPPKAASPTERSGAGDPTSDRARGATPSAAPNTGASAAGGRPPGTAPPLGAQAGAPPRPTAAPAAQQSSPSRASITDVVPRRTLLIVAVIVVLAIVGTVLALTLGGGDDSSEGKSAAPAHSGSTGNDEKAEGATGDAVPTGDSSDTAERSEHTDDGGSKKGDGDAGDDGLPEGYERVTDRRFHFTMALPEGWRGRSVPGYSGGTIYSASGGFPRVQVDFNTSPKSDAAEAWRGAEPGARKSMSDYHSRGIDTVDWRDYPTVADWKFERDQQGKRVRVVNRGFKVDDGHGYAIMITCEKREWDKKECAALRDAAFGTFQPKDS